MILLGKNKIIFPNSEQHRFSEDVILTHDDYSFETQSDLAAIEMNSEIEDDVEDISTTNNLPEMLISDDDNSAYGDEIDPNVDVSDADVVQAPINSRNIINDMETDGLHYFLGWVAKKLNHKFPYLGSHTYMNRRNLHNYTTPSWIQHLSRGGLCEPSDYLINIGQIMENLFN